MQLCLCEPGNYDYIEFDPINGQVYKFTSSICSESKASFGYGASDGREYWSAG
jgi:hypothetical protein